MKSKINFMIYELNYFWIWLWSMTRCKSMWHYHELFWIPLILHYRYTSGIPIWMSGDAFVAPPSRQCWSNAVCGRLYSWTGKSIVQFGGTIEPLFEAPNAHCGIANKWRYFGTSNWKNELLERRYKTICQTNGTSFIQREQRTAIIRFWPHEYSTPSY